MTNYSFLSEVVNSHECPSVKLEIASMSRVGQYYHDSVRDGCPFSLWIVLPYKYIYIYIYNIHTYIVQRHIFGVSLLAPKTG